MLSILLTLEVIVLSEDNPISPRTEFLAGSKTPDNESQHVARVNRHSALSMNLSIFAFRQVLGEPRAESAAGHVAICISEELFISSGKKGLSTFVLSLAQVVVSLPVPEGDQARASSRG